MRRYPEPPKWSISEIEAHTATAREIYATRRPTQGREAYQVAYGEAVEQVTHLFDLSDDLRAFATVLRSHPRLLDVARYVDAPPISAEDLATVSRVAKSSMTSAAMNARATVLEAGLDRDRFAWLFESHPRRPSPAERHAAVAITASLVASQRAATVLRTLWATRQEQAVADAVAAGGYARTSRRQIDSMADLPAGHFCPESRVFGQKCDVPVGLRNGRYLLIECKVSGSEVNLYKRLNHETVNKRDEWARGFAAQAYTAAVLDGVFRPVNPLSAQERGVHIFWEYDLTPLAAFLGEVG